MLRKDFRGEVWTNVHPSILEYVMEINSEPIEGGVGYDKYSLNAIKLMQDQFKDPIYALYTLNGTAANIIALKTMLNSYSSVICAKESHVNVYECGAIEYNVGTKMIVAESENGKLTVQSIEKAILENKKYKIIPKVITITEPTELGTVYTVEEMKSITDYAHKNGMYVYIDGARLSVACSYLDMSIGELIEKSDVDAFSFGGTKAGALFGEMVIFRRKEFSYALDYILKQSMQHLDKSKFLGAQIEYLLKTELWRENALKGIEMAKYLEMKLIEKGIKIEYPVESNMVFCYMTDEQLQNVTKEFDLHYWNVFDKSVRLCTTFDTKKEAIDDFIKLL